MAAARPPAPKQAAHCQHAAHRGAVAIKRGFVADRTRLSGTMRRIFRGVSVRDDPEAAGISHD
jgi:hypothetical protein